MASERAVYGAVTASKYAIDRLAKNLFGAVEKPGGSLEFAFFFSLAIALPSTNLDWLMSSECLSALTLYLNLPYD